MKKLLLPLLLLLVTMFGFSPTASACSAAPQPVGHAGSGYVYKIVGSGSDLLVTYGNPSGFNTTRTIQFGSWSGVTFVGTWVSATNLLTSMTAPGHTWPDGQGGMLSFNNSGAADIEIHAGHWLGSQGTWSDGVTDITGLGLGQRNLTFSGIDNGTLNTRTYGAFGHCSSFSQTDLDAVGMAIMSEPKRAPRLWWQD